jgi:hypothetical protein
MYFSLASTFLLISISFYYGPLNYFKSLFEKEKILISTLYLVSTIASLSTIFIKSGYLWSIGLIVIQAVSLSFFIIQVFSGGNNASK